MKKKPSIQQKTLRMQDNHTWQAPKGYKIVVLDRGVVSFNVPHKWIVANMEPFEMHDAKPPHDDARITVSYWRTMAGVDWHGLPLPILLAKSTEDTRGEGELLEAGEIMTSERTDLEIVWKEHRFMDPVEKREAYTRILLARGFNVHALLTFDYWRADVKKSLPIWEEILRSLLLGRTIADPTKGEVMH